MEIVHKKDFTKDYTCDVCGTEFNWHKDAWRYGKMEYKTIPEKNRIDKKFCSSECKDKILIGAI